MPYFTPSPSLSLFYSLHGDATNPPILLIHGWACDSTDWSFTIPALMQKYHVITLDLRGHGHSSAPSSLTYSIKDSTDDAVALLTHLDLTKDVLVMGHSMGAIVASCLTGLYPELFRGLVVIDPPYWRTKQFWSTMLPKWGELQNGLVFVTMAFGNQMPPEGVMPPWMLTWYGIRMQAVNERVVGESLKGAFGPGMLGQQEAHTQLVKGRRVPRLAVYMTEENCGKERRLGMGVGDEVVWIKDAGHWLHHIADEEFNGVLVEWLGKVEGRG
ncbi:alpha/beta-hydrolase [Ophiobolus disseminans]|uniref:Alpha/beta-hydrolase n=1 Tax=Ophiobolus disseminans TaxID=1469910 RepID=A0A6A7AC86_9PLEO|nr:alpha/beta-hydrolase [Ophiobolus disseminans]